MSADGHAGLSGQGFQLEMPEQVLSGAGAKSGQEVVLGVRPEDLKDARYAEGNLPKIPAKVEVLEMMGNEIFVYAKLGEDTLTTRMDNRSGDLQPGQDLQLAVDISHVHLFDRATQDALVTAGAPA